MSIYREGNMEGTISLQFQLHQRSFLGSFKARDKIHTSVMLQSITSINQNAAVVAKPGSFPHNEALSVQFHCHFFLFPLLDLKVSFFPHCFPSKHSPKALSQAFPLLQYAMDIPNTFHQNKVYSPNSHELFPYQCWKTKQ